jgi:acetyl esterase
MLWRDDAPRFAALGLAGSRAFVAARAAAQAAAAEPVARVEELATGVGVALRLYVPAGEVRGCLVYAHGGGWVLGDLTTADPQCRVLANAAGVAVASVAYRLAPEHPYPAGLRDLYAAAAWLADRTADLGLSAGPLFVGGESAGANLAAGVALLARDLGGPRLRGQVLHYPLLDCGCDTGSYRQFADFHHLTAQDARWFWELYAPDPATRAGAYASPGRAPDLTGLPETYLVAAGQDVLRDEVESYAGRLIAAGVPVTAARAPGCHGFLGWPARVPEAVRWLRRAGRWIRERAHARPGAEV